MKIRIINIDNTCVKNLIYKIKKIDFFFFFSKKNPSILYKTLMSFCGRKTYIDANGKCHNISGMKVNEIRDLVQ